MAWDITIPADSAAANTIHTLLQTAKADIHAVGKCLNDDSWEEHNWLTGRHKQSQVGWLTVFAGGGAVPYIHDRVGVMYWDSTGTDLYLHVEAEKVPVQVTTMDHNDLTERSEDDHTQYYLRDGTRPMEADLTLEADKTWTFTNTASTESDSCMFSSHAGLSWSAAHAGTDGGLKNRHFADASINSPSTRSSATATYISATGLNCLFPGLNKASEMMLFDSGLTRMTYTTANTILGSIWMMREWA